MRTEAEAIGLEVLNLLQRANRAEQANDMLARENAELKKKIDEMNKPEGKAPAKARTPIKKGKAG